jgi:hypothetical protein
MAIARPVRICLGAALVQRQLDLEIVFLVAQINQGEVWKIQLARFMQIQYVGIEAQGLVEIKDLESWCERFLP